MFAQEGVGGSFSSDRFHLLIFCGQICNLF